MKEHPVANYDVYIVVDDKTVKQTRRPLTKWRASMMAARLSLQGHVPMIKEVSTGNWVA